MISNPLIDIPGCVIWLDAADTSTLGTEDTGPTAIDNGDPIKYWRNKANPAKSFTQSSSTRTPTYYRSLSAVNLENQFTDPFLEYFGSPGNEFVFNKKMTVIMLCSVTDQRTTIGSNTVNKTMFELSAANVVSNRPETYPQTDMFVPLMVSRNELGWTGQPDTYRVGIGSGLNRDEIYTAVNDQRNNYNFYNVCGIGHDISQNISETIMITSRLDDNFLVNFKGLSRTNALSADGTLLNYYTRDGSPLGILKSAITRIGKFPGALYEILVYDNAISFDQLNDIQNYFYRKWTPVGVKIKRDVYPESSGNWSTINWSFDSEPAPWNTIFPTDVVYTNGGYTVDIDTNIQVDTILNKNLKDINNPVAIGTGNNGTFNLTNNVSITADLYSVSSNHYWLTLSPGASATINGSFYGAATSNVLIFLTSLGRYANIAELRNILTPLGLIESNNNTIDNVSTTQIKKNKVYALSADGSCSLTINGDIVSASKGAKYLGRAGQGYRPIFWNSNNPLFLNGNIIMYGEYWSATTAPANLNRIYHVVTNGPFYMKGDIYPSRVYNAIQSTYNYGVVSTNVMFLTGNVYSGTGNNGFGIINDSGILHIKGNVEVDFGAPTDACRAVRATGNSQNYITGNIVGSKYGNSGTDVHALQLLDNSYCYVLGDIYGGTGNNSAAAILVENTTTLEVSGDIYPVVAPGIYSTSTLPVSVYFANDGFNFSGGELSAPAILANKMFLKEAPDPNKKFTKFQTTEGNFTFYLTDLLSFSYPPSSDVKHNLLYGPSYSLTGDMHIPETSAVAWDIPIKTDVRINKLIPGERYQIVQVDPIVPFTDFGASANIPGISFKATSSSTRGGFGIAKTVGKAVVTTVDIMTEDINRLNPGTLSNPTWRTTLENNRTNFDAVSAIAKSYNYFDI